MKLLDTNVCIDLLRGRSPRVHQRYKAAAGDQLAVSSITAGELYAGALKSRRVEENLQAANLLLSGLPILAFGAEAARTYGKERSRLEIAGRRIGDLDMLIAAHAVATDAMLITNNTREFRRIANLIVDDWTK
ncbi:MAG: type II toxin-antitoxin system VapC family toxin [Gemmatimonadota bacterium]|nr:type II toxin-antitoxin system VapC family toxin [Gemmatimonadota bacterium]